MNRSRIGILASIGLLACVAAVRCDNFAVLSQTAVVQDMRLPFPVGEKLIYEIKLARFPLNVTLGHITFEYVGPSTERKISGTSLDLGTENTREMVRLKAEAVSKGFLVTLFGINVHDRFETLVERADFSARLSLREEDEGKKNLAKTTLLEPEVKLVKYKVLDLNKPEGPPRLVELPLKPRMQSLLSAIYYFRTFELADDQVVCFPVSEDGENHEFEILVRGREAAQ
ncbi:MAG: DUF3108 domain-containing protein, partial [Acidobacteriota bacterium]